MCKVNINSALNGIELSFDSKPDATVLTTLKENGFRWHNKKKMWYAKITDDRMIIANSLSGIETVKPAGNDQAALLNEIMIEYAKIWTNSKMLDYCRKKCAYVVKLNNGYYEIDKPSIETHFCFGYGYCGISTQEDMDDAENMRRHAATDEEYFIKENLKGINYWLDNLSTMDVYACYNYSCKGDQARIYNIMCLKPWDVDRYSNNQGFYKLSKEEIDDIITGYKVVKNQFEKRLNTYLKKYGLTKLKTWTYLSD